MKSGGPNVRIFIDASPGLRSYSIQFSAGSPSPRRKKKGAAGLVGKKGGILSCTVREKKKRGHIYIGAIYI